MEDDSIELSDSEASDSGTTGRNIAPMPNLAFEKIRGYGLIYGEKYVLSYTKGMGDDVFSITIGTSHKKVVETFPLTDEGWRSAFSSFTQLEPDAAERGRSKLQRAAEVAPAILPDPPASAAEEHLVLEEIAGELRRWAACEECGETQWVPAQKTLAWKCKNCSAKNREHLGIILPQVRIYGSGIGSSGANGQFSFFKSGVRVTGGLLGGGGFLRWDNVSDFSVDDPEGFQKRYTATRIFTLGIFAAAVPKWQATSHLTIRSRDEGWTAMFKMPSLALTRSFSPQARNGKDTEPTRKNAHQLRHKPRTSHQRSDSSAP
jgi:hypothetical protein